FAVERGREADLLPLWVADMDFPAAQPILDSLTAAVQHGIFGYSDAKESYFQALAGWYRTHFNWSIEKEWLVKTPGVVFALAMAVRALTREGDSVLIQQPVYYPFSQTIVSNHRKLVSSDLVLRDGHYEMDFEDFERKIVENEVKLFILCSPHNPVGRVWTQEELKTAGDICIRHGVLVVSDEIHSDFTYPGQHHYVFAGLKPEFAQNSIICTAPSKTFNLAGLQVSNILIPNKTIRVKFQNEITAAGYSQVNALGLIACQAAYTGGGEWLTQLKKYLKGNLDFVRSFLKENIPGVRLIEPEGTYLIWLDFGELGLDGEALDMLIEKKAKLWLDSGSMFGKSGEGFQRINIACPRKILEQAMDQLRLVCC
ncbi:MAG: pyridoxal phosphate-dependent aminotransferase, partial [Lachnospiraceae bacterium]|nr:pyridoxal phosphate-dependent aminotransferase [Lachnospiraceae bacterium]